MKKLKHQTSKQKKKLTFMVIPNTTSKIIQFTVRSWVPGLILSFILILVISAVGFSGKLVLTYEQLYAAKDSIQRLTIENESHIDEIIYLRDRSMEIEEKLLSLNELQTKVLNLVGLEPSDEIPETEPIFLVSRSDQRTLLSYADHEKDLDQLEKLIEMQTENMEKLVKDVEKQLDYLDSLPDLRPAPGRISSPFGYRISPISRTREFHRGIDIANATNTPIKAAGSGVVTFSGYNGGYGRVVMISHGYGYISLYAHNNQNLVKVGQRVQKGEIIARMGSTGNSTGPHVHFEIRKNGQSINPLSILQN